MYKWSLMGDGVLKSGTAPTEDAARLDMQEAGAAAGLSPAMIRHYGRIMPMEQVRANLGTADKARDIIRRHPTYSWSQAMALANGNIPGR